MNAHMRHVHTHHKHLSSPSHGPVLVVGLQTIALADTMMYLDAHGTLSCGQDAAYAKQLPRPVDGTTLPALEYEVDVEGDENADAEETAATLPDEPLVWVVAGVHREKGAVDRQRSGALVTCFFFLFPNSLYPSFDHLDAASCVCAGIIAPPHSCWSV